MPKFPMDSQAFLKIYKSVQPELKALFERYISQPQAKKLYRYDHRYQYEPFSERLQYNQGTSMNAAGEPGGVYWAKSPVEATMLKSGSGAIRMPDNASLLTLSPRDQELYEAASRKAIQDFTIQDPHMNMEGVASPNARFQDFDYKEWIKKGYDKMPLKELTNKFKNETDFVSFPDLAVGNLALKNIVQVNPHQSVVKINDWGKILYKILGAGGIAAGATQTQEAEASPLGEVFKAAGKKALLPASRTAEALIGRIVNGKQVKNVVQDPSHDAWRYLIFEDGSAQALTKDMLADAMANHGTKLQLNKLATKTTQEQIDQAKKSLQYHQNRSRVLPARDTATKESHARLAESHRDTRNQNLKDLGITPEDIVTIQTKQGSFTIPRKYAELLELDGTAKIVPTQVKGGSK